MILLTIFTRRPARSRHGRHARFVSTKSAASSIPAFRHARPDARHEGRPPDLLSRGGNMERIVDIATDGRHLSAYRGFLIVAEDRQEVGRIPLDDIAAVIVHAHGVTWSTNLIVAL